jgi:cysteinyl-tRNA synthetase
VIKDFNRLEKLGVSSEYIEAVKKVVSFVKLSTGLVHDNPQKILDELNNARKNLSGTKSGNEEEIEKLLADRKEARATKNWARSDEIIKLLNEMGIVVKDNPDGSISWSYK